MPGEHLDLTDPLFSVVRGYASLSPLRLLSTLPGIHFEEAHDFFLNRLLLSPHFQAYPPSERYQALFWKWAIGNLDALLDGQDAEIDDRLYNHLVDLIQSSSFGMSGTQPPSESYVTYLWKSPDAPRASIFPGVASATLLESRTLIERGTTGLTTWTASITLAEFLILRPELVQGQHVLELGCGAGFLGIVVATLQQQSSATTKDAHDRSALRLTDVDSAVLKRCQNNIQLPCNISSVHPNVHCTRMDWTDAADPVARPSLEALIRRIDADVIIGADIVFDPGIIPALVDTLSLVMSIGKSMGRDIIAYIALTVRNEKTHSQFVGAAERSLQLLDISTEMDEQRLLGVHSNEDQEVRLYQLQYSTSETPNVP